MGARIVLRPLAEADITARYVSWFADTDVTRFLEARDISVDDARAYLTAGRESRSYFLYAICLRTSHRHIGNLKIGPINWRHRVADLVTVIGDKGCWGQGLASEAIALGSRVAFEVYGLRKLHGAILAGNVGSIKAYLRGGWDIEGRLRAQYLVDGVATDTVLVSCLAPPELPTRSAPPR